MSRSVAPHGQDVHQGIRRRGRRAGPTPLKNLPNPRGQELHHTERPAAAQRRLKFLLTRERRAVTQVVAWAASNGDRSENADYRSGNAARDASHQTDDETEGQ